MIPITLQSWWRNDHSFRLRLLIPLLGREHALLLRFARARGLWNVVFEVAVQAQVLLVAAVLFQENAWFTDALCVKNASQGRHVAFIIGWDKWIQLRSDFVGQEVFTL